MELRTTQVVVFGSPEVGTKHMHENPGIALDLPLCIAVWKDADGSVRAAFRR